MTSLITPRDQTRRRRQQYHASGSAFLDQCRVDSGAFASAISGFMTEPFEQEWHEQWSAPGARAVTWAAVESGKTTQMTAFALWLLGRNPREERIILASADLSMRPRRARWW